MSECVCVVLCVCLCVSALFGFGTSQPYNVFILYLYTIFTSASMWRFFLSLVACMHACIKDTSCSTHTDTQVCSKTHVRTQ